MVSKIANPHLNPPPRASGAKGMHRASGVVSPAPDALQKPLAKPQPRQRVKTPKPEGPLKKATASALRRAAHKEALEQGIVDAARALFVAQGQEAVTLREVAAAVGYSHATLYSFFADKAALLARLGAEGREGLRAALEGQLSGPGDARAALRRVAAAYLRWAVAHPHHYRLLTLDPLPAEADDEPDAYALLRDLLARLPGGDTDLRAQTVWAALHGAALLEIALVPGSGKTWPWRDLQARITAVAELVAAA
ncbi:TetR/AcrR family transcriptional regulator [Paucibacter sp. M5-1]|uniref:TetR/AcrR family transcriptional regulator n=1 Tax=Paucibacter sp. M5-1 TaxID=3015998 RepID=UPI0022B93B11|nr:TetR/AcrR family transcriptional regulator [Paucibacter sp. M5-1]MCZ7884408.1 TetR/AcrR family transcriptional regulator [Paucibacter sp. M5-1]